MQIFWDIARVAQTLIALFLLTVSTPAKAADNPFTTSGKGVYGGIKQILLKTAEQVPEADYAFRPTESVRSFGEIVGHVADAQYTFCSVAVGAKRPDIAIEKNKSSKAELIVALNDAFTYCDKAYDGMTDETGARTVKFMGADMPRLGVLAVNSIHSMEHYGNLVTYMRLKNIVPPTSDPDFMKRLMAR